MVDSCNRAPGDDLGRRPGGLATAAIPAINRDVQL